MFHKTPLEASSASQMHDGVKLVEFVVNNTPFVQFTAPDAQSNTVGQPPRTKVRGFPGYFH